MSSQHVVGGAAGLGGQDAQRLALAVLFFETGEVLLPLGIEAEEQDCGFGEGPLEGGVAHLLSTRGLLFTGRFAGSFDQARVGEEILDSRKAFDVVDLVESSWMAWS